MPSRRDQIRMSDAELSAFLGEQKTMQCATNGPRGLPHMFECDVALERDAERVTAYGVELFERYGDGGELAPDARAMVEQQAAKRVGLRFTPTRSVTWDHRKLGGTY